VSIRRGGVVPKSTVPAAQDETAKSLARDGAPHAARLCVEDPLTDRCAAAPSGLEDVAVLMLGEPEPALWGHAACRACRSPHRLVCAEKGMWRRPARPRSDLGRSVVPLSWELHAAPQECVERHAPDRGGARGVCGDV
jgi:hypothetical protein